MDIKTVLYVLVLGWIAGSNGVPPGMLDWFTARERVGTPPAPISCTLDGTSFQLRQVVVTNQGGEPLVPTGP